MAGRSLRAQLNQIRAWVREGRTDAWIAHQLEVSTSELRDFRRRHELSADDEHDPGDDLRDEIEAEIEAATLAEEDEDEEVGDEDAEDGDRDADDASDDDDGADDDSSDDDDSPEDGDEDRGDGRRRRRRRRGGRGRRRGKRFEGTFDHGDKDGYGLWLDPAVSEHPAYKEHWKDQRAVEVSVEPDQIVIRRASSD